MAGLKAIKTKIRSIEKTRKVTKAMEAVSAAKMRKAQSSALSARAYARAAVSILARVSGSRELKNHPLTRQSSQRPDKRLYIVITSDKGLAGALNSSVLRIVQNEITDFEQYSLERPKIIAIGRKANDFFVNRGYEVVYHPNVDIIDYSLINQIVGAAAARFTEGAVDVVKIAYQNFISTFEQRPTLRTMFPLSVEELQKVVDDIIPAKGAFSDKGLTSAQSGGQTFVVSYTVEPSESEVLDAILPRLAGIFVYHALLETKASEHSARMVSMKSASDKAQELTHSFTLQFNKARQAAITREVSEIISGTL
ncbi:MAG: ATP synthase F1 subunit gamma [Patescibacteria group bacterium]|nr:ATP synthase F1 subunit gamma [Patescibacteria group bacterium]